MASTDLTEGKAFALLKEACAADGLDSDGASLMRLGSNAVIHLKTPVVARVSRKGADAEEAFRTVAVARWLESVDYPAVRLVGVDQPVVVDGHAVTFWKSVSRDGQQYATVSEVAEVFARLHQLEAPANLNLPVLDPFDNAAYRISANDWLSGDDRAFLTQDLVKLQSQYSELEFALPAGVIHGDANIGNVLHDADGHPVVIDLDGFAVGPREWDLIQTAIFYDSFGWHTREEYKTFVQVYGFDIMKWPGYPTMRALREFLMVTWIIQQAGGNERVAAEARKRINALRTGASRKDWSPY